MYTAPGPASRVVARGGSGLPAALGHVARVRGVRQAQALAITSPGKSVKVKGRMKVTVRASRAYTRVTFGVDGRVLWVDPQVPLQVPQEGGTEHPPPESWAARPMGRRQAPERRSGPGIARVLRPAPEKCAAAAGRADAASTRPRRCPFGATGAVPGRLRHRRRRAVPKRAGGARPGHGGHSGPAPFQGSHRARFEVRPGDESAGGNRAEVTGPNFSEGDERWIRQAIYVPSGTATESGWRLVAAVPQPRRRLPAGRRVPGVGART